MIDRLKEFIDNQGISVSALEDKINAGDGTLRRAIKNKTDIQSKWLKKISENYPNLSLDWLITGKGEMYKHQDEGAILEVKRNEQEETRPRIPMNAAAGSLSVALSGVTVGECELVPVIKAFPNYDFTVFARGDSMEPEFHSGDELACLFVTPNSFIQWGHYHVLDTAQGFIIKKIYDSGEYILCRSEESELYPDFKVHKSEVYSIALVIGSVRRY